MGLFYILHVVVCILLVVTILFQDGKTGGLTGIADNASQQMFGAKGAADFLTKLTTGLAVFFMVTSLFLAIMSTPSGKSIADDYEPQKTQDSSLATSEAEEQEPSGVDTSESAGVVITDEEGNQRVVPLSEAIGEIETVPFDEAPEEIKQAHIQEMQEKERLRREQAAKQAEEEPPEQE